MKSSATTTMRAVMPTRRMMKMILPALAVLSMTGGASVADPPGSTTSGSPRSLDGAAPAADGQADAGRGVKVIVTNQSSYGTLTPPNAPGFDSLTAGKPLEGDWWLGTQVGELNISVHKGIRIVKLNNQVLAPDRAVWQSQDMLQIFDATHNRYFAVSLAPGNKINFVRPGSWLQYTPDNAPRVAIGIYTEPLSAGMAAQLGLTPGDALMVTGLVENLPAQKAGIQQFDVITALDGASPVTTDLLRQVVLAKDPGDTVQLSILRRARPMTLNVAVEAVDPKTISRGGPANNAIDWHKMFPDAPPQVFDFPATSDAPIIQFGPGNDAGSDQQGFLFQFPDDASSEHSTQHANPRPDSRAPSKATEAPNSQTTDAEVSAALNLHISMLESRMSAMQAMIQRQNQMLEQLMIMQKQMIQHGAAPPPQTPLNRRPADH